MAQADSSQAEKLLHAGLHVTPPTVRVTHSFAPLSSCCAAPEPSSRMLNLDDWAAGPPSTQARHASGKLLDAYGALHVPPNVSKDVEELFTDLHDHQEKSFKRPRVIEELFADLRDHQEKSFKRVLEQQQALKNQMLIMTSDFKAIFNSTAFLQARHEDCIADLNRLLTAYPVLDVARLSELLGRADLGHHLNADATEKSVTPAAGQGDQELPCNTCAPNASPDTAEKSITPAPEKELQKQDPAEKSSAPDPEKELQKSNERLSCRTVADEASPGSHKKQVQLQGLQSSVERLSRTSFGRKSNQSHQSQKSAKPTSQKMIQIVKQKTTYDAAGVPAFSVHKRLSYWLRGKKFQVGIAVILLMNSFVMCWEAQYQGLQVGFDLQYPGRLVEAHIIWPGAPLIFKVLDWSFGILFSAEMVAKLLCWGTKYFFEAPAVTTHQSYSAKDGRFHTRTNACIMQFLRGVQYFNLLDLFCVAGFVFSKVAAAGKGNTQLPRLLRLLRLGRLVKLCRFLESCDHLYVMTTALSALSEVLLWAVVLLSMILLTCDLFLTQVLHTTYFDQAKADTLTQEQLERHQEMYAYFGTWTRCILSMFEITLGNWPPVARLLMEEVSEWFIIFCLAHKLTFGFAVLGVINGVILQQTFKVASSDDLILYREKQKAKEILRKKFEALFLDLDESGDGRLEIAEVEKIGELPEIRTWLGGLGIETHDLRALFELIDSDGSGYVTIDEILSQLPIIRGTARSADVLQLLNMQRHLVAIAVQQFSLEKNGS